ncbi:MAG: NAD(P)-dependent glycerol-3-phosphate dehydrogenase [Verrucomicrobiota bacterium]|jgi:glycerol-3-phosphate dehydrogenase (NAD(P)+)|nr:NAD(P)-dependent glycerol-3-phosphate dehydrogenase [Verrucomicrobiota bacterium]MDD8051498.1 NAD(P)-dependent glycerol-3-phosphate dehydrogenase [Verrucomicrobiota bacterium]MDI9384203.1 NAD(P)H-dependent glycerol-3-phosphate dehydrogenase [Verrucomicrobiota bacterium]HCF95895.1 glycerol-3-phosphate dehydrogenase [Verrucomicrobiota bacterium]
MTGRRVGVLGLGSWGSALGLVLREAEVPFRGWSPLVDQVRLIQETGTNPDYLPGIDLGRGFPCTDDLDAVVRWADTLLLVIPSRYLRDVCGRIAGMGVDPRLVINAGKGLDHEHSSLLSDLIAGELPGWPQAVLSGPSHAEEVAAGIPTLVVAAAAEQATAEAVRDLFMTARFRVYSSTDLIGVQVGGAVKNVIALAAGCIDGLGLGDNTKAALITRGLVEVARLGVAMGGKPETFFGLSGLGDLVVTCESRHSRNRHVGEQLGRGRSLEEVLGEMVMVAEGVWTAETVCSLSRRLGVEAPISEQVWAVLQGRSSPLAAVEALMTRDPRQEMEAFSGRL